MGLRVPWSNCWLQDKEFVNSVLEKINADSLRSFLKTLSKEPHIAASERDKWDFFFYYPMFSLLKFGKTNYIQFTKSPTAFLWQDDKMIGFGSWFFIPSRLQSFLSIRLEAYILE